MWYVVGQKFNFTLYLSINVKPFKYKSNPGACISKNQVFVLNLLTQDSDITHRYCSIIYPWLSICRQWNFAKKNHKRSTVAHVISSDILLSAPSTPLHKSDNTQDHGKSNGGKKRLRAQAPPSELRHFLLGYPPSYDLWGEKERWWRGKSEC